MGHKMKIKCVDSRMNVHNLASTSVPFTDNSARSLHEPIAPLNGKYNYKITYNVFSLILSEILSPAHPSANFLSERQ
jgi:hypothetical protein